jgi:small subunit ribosomal protein S6
MATLTETSEELRIYECAVLYRHPLSQKEEQQVLKEVEGLFEEAGGTLVAKDLWGRRGLAYPIGGLTEGNFVIYHYEVDPAKVKEIDRTLRITPGVLRHLLIKPPKGYQIVKYSGEYEKWLKERESAGAMAEKRKEEELTRQVIERAKRKAKVKEEKAPEKAAAPVEGEKLTQEIEKLISEEGIDL